MVLLLLACQIDIQVPTLHILWLQLILGWRTWDMSITYLPVVIYQNGLPCYTLFRIANSVALIFRVLDISVYWRVLFCPRSSPWNLLASGFSHCDVYTCHCLLYSSLELLYSYYLFAMRSWPPCGFIFLKCSWWEVGACFVNVSYLCCRSLHFCRFCLFYDFHRIDGSMTSASRRITVIADLSPSEIACSASFDTLSMSSHPSNVLSSLIMRISIARVYSVLYPTLVIFPRCFMWFDFWVYQPLVFV